MMINEVVEVVFYQSAATLAQNINLLFSPRHFTIILLSQISFANCNRTGPALRQAVTRKYQIGREMFCNVKQVSGKLLDGLYYNE